MANLLNYDHSQLLGLLLVLVRVGAIMGSAPIFGNNNIPAQIKITVAFVITLILYPILPPIELDLSNTASYLVLIASELLIGMVLGLVGQFLFAAIQFAGEIASMQMGFSMASVMDPNTQTQVGIIGQMHTTLATLLFLAMDAHHVVLQALVHSYTLIPAGGASLSQGLYDQMVTLSAGVFLLGFQLGAPLLISLFLANILMGLMARSVPQLNIFVVGFPVTLMLGMFLMGVGTPILIHALRLIFESFDNQMFEVIQLLAKK